MIGNRALVAAGKVPKSPAAERPLTHKIWCFYNLWIAKILTSLTFSWQRFKKPLPPSTRPTTIKRYQSRPKLPVRIFYPDNYKSGEKLPLFLCVHSGGYAMHDAESDDEWCRMWSNRTHMLIASMDHSMAPQHAFPTPVYDIAALGASVLDDADLPIDKERVVIGGFSSGGNIAMGAAQLPGLKGRAKASLSFFMPIDFGIDYRDKVKNKPYKSLGPELLESASDWMDWGYVSPGQDRHDPLLSPYWAKREDLPTWICTIGAEYDILRMECQQWMCELAGLEHVQEESFERGTLKWILAKRCTHLFTHHWGMGGEKKRKREAKAEAVYVEVEEWLKRALA
ncbi:alpha/beta hydrolase fold domain-containing protein [Sarocladium implicatum]|nr:alpha/beta hydrolase fold domain-containing protein [Sarocladium implicatum]